MKEIYLFILVFSILVPLVEIKAQVTPSSGIKPEQIQITRDGDDIQIALTINVENINLDSQEMIILTPMAISEDSVVMHTFKPVVIAGSKRRKALNRALEFGTYKFTGSPQLLVTKNRVQSIPLNLKLPYDRWIHSSTLVFHEKKTGCACEKEYAGSYHIIQILSPLFNPEYKVSYITPPVEEIKTRKDTYSSGLSFKVNRYEILQDFENNGQVLSEVSQIIKEVQNDPNLTVSEFLVTGYASPEGDFQQNTTLSENRAESFVNYLSNNYGITPSNIGVYWKGEDWEGRAKTHVINTLYYWVETG